MTAADVKKNIFWIFCPLAVLIAFGTYWISLGAVSKAFQDRKDQLESSLKTVRDISSDSLHPTEKSIEQVKEMTGVVSDKVMVSWTLLEKDQRERNQWPVDLPREFHRVVVNLKQGDPIPQLQREMYYQFIKQQIPIMLDNVGARKLQYKKSKWNQETNELEYLKDEEGNDIWLDVLEKWGVDAPRDASGGGAGGMPSMGGGMSGPGMGGGTTPGSGPNPGSGLGASMFGGGAGGAGGGSMMGGGMGGPGGGMGGGLGGGMSPTMGGGGPGGAGGMSGGGMGTGGDDIVLQEDIRRVGSVDWPNPEILGLIPSGVPTATQIWYIQEDLWVYDALLWVIKETNKVVDEDVKNLAETHYRSPIKQISNLLIGSNATIELMRMGLIEGAGMMGGSGMDPSSAMSDMSGGGGGGGGLASMMSGGMGGGMGGPGGGSGANISTISGIIGFEKLPEDQIRSIILKNRYVGAELEPLDDLEGAPFKEFNQMPVVLRLIVDQRKIPEVLANCANCAMPIDVLMVRFNPEKGGPILLPSAAGMGGGMDGGGGGDPSSSMMGGPGGMMGGPGGMMGGPGGMMGGPGGGRGGESGMGVQVSGSVGDYNSESILIEIFGIINIFNPPEHSALAAAQRAAEEERLREAEAAAQAQALQPGLEEEEPEESVEEETPEGFPEMGIEEDGSTDPEEEPLFEETEELELPEIE